MTVATHHSATVFPVENGETLMQPNQDPIHSQQDFIPDRGKGADSSDAVDREPSLCPRHPDAEQVPDPIPSDPYRAFCVACENTEEARTFDAARDEYFGN